MFLDTALAIAGLLMDKVYQEARGNEAHGQNDWATNAAAMSML